MALELVTGYWGQNHVTAEQEADLNAGIFGSGFYVLPVGEKMRAEAVTSNQVRIFDGIFVGYGRQASIEEGGYENVTIENGTAGLLRNDMIVIKYNKDEESGIESVAFDVLKGQTGSTAQDPVPNNQDIRAGAFESEMPLYRVKLNGLAIEAIEPLFTVPKSIPELMQDISDLEDENAKLNSALVYMPRYDNLVDGSSFNKDFLSIYLPAHENRLNAANYFSKPASDSEWSNIPAELSGKMWLGYRAPQRMGGTNELVVITEHFPVAGRIWTNYYNSGTWQGWKSITPQ